MYYTFSTIKGIKFTKRHLKRFCLGGVLALLSGAVFAQQSIPVCSSIARNSVKESISEWTSVIQQWKDILGRSIATPVQEYGPLNRHNNHADLTPFCSFQFASSATSRWTSEERAGWVKFRSIAKNKNDFAQKGGTLTNILDFARYDEQNVRVMQQVIQENCGLTLTRDGHIGMRTLNAAKYCTSNDRPCAGTVPPTVFIANKDKIQKGSSNANACCITSTTNQEGNDSVTGLPYCPPVKECESTITEAKNKGCEMGTENICSCKKAECAALNGKKICPDPTPTAVPCLKLDEIPESARSSCEVGKECSYPDPSDPSKTIISKVCSCPDGQTLKDGKCESCVDSSVTGPLPEGQSYCEEKEEPSCDPSKECCGIKLNTTVPFIGNCIQYAASNDTYDSNYGGSDTTIVVNILNAFPLLIGGLSRILITVILIGSFLMVIYSGVMIATGDTSWRGVIYKVIRGILLLGASGVILNAINPNFFQ